MQSLAEAIAQIPTWMKLAAALGAMFSAGMLVQEKWALMEKQPQDIADMQRTLEEQAAQLETLRIRLSTILNNSARITFLEDAVCTPPVIESLGPDRDRRCFAMTRAREASTAPQVIPLPSDP